MYSFLYYRIDFFLNLINYAKERNRMEKFSVYETPAQLLSFATTMKGVKTSAFQMRVKSTEIFIWRTIFIDVSLEGIWQKMNFKWLRF